MINSSMAHPFTPNGGHGLDMPPPPPGTREHAPRRRTPLGGGSTTIRASPPPASGSNSRNSSSPPSPTLPSSDGAGSDEGPTTPTQLQEFEAQRRIDYREAGVARRLSLGLRSGEVTPWLRAKLETLRLDLHPHASAMGVGPTGSIPESPRENLRSFWLVFATALVTGAGSCYALRRASASGALHLRAATFRAAGGSNALGARGMLLFRVAALCVGIHGVRPDNKAPGTLRACARAGSFSAFAWMILCASSAAGAACSWLALWGGTQSFTALQHVLPSIGGLSVFSLPVSAWLLFEAALAATLLVALLASCVFVPSELACW